MVLNLMAIARNLFGEDPCFVEQVFSRIASLNLELLEGLEGVVLDDGCGRGYQTRRLASTGRFSPVGIDIFESDVRLAKLSANYPVVVGNGCNLPFPAGTFDVVISNQVIEHVEHYERYFEEAARVLRSRGYLLLSTENRERIINFFITNVLKQKPVLRWPNDQGLPSESFRGHLEEFTEQELRALLQNHGFEIIAVTGIPPRLWRTKGILRTGYNIAKVSAHKVMRYWYGKVIYDNLHILARKCC
jgi:2-polyprenyl-3-methyl-5-hydroxy-6-metoxy-1,4-benzoquinol methylase